MLPDKEALWAKFEADGEDKVRENLVNKRYGERKEPMAREWLRQQDEKRATKAATRQENTQQAQIDVSRRSNRVGWYLVAATVLGARIVAIATLVE